MLRLEDTFLAMVFLIVVYSVAYVIYKKKYHGTKPGKVFLLGLTFKLIGALSLGLIYQFYYGDGDTFYYFRGGLALEEALLHDSDAGWEMITSNEMRTKTFENLPYYKRIVYHDREGFTMVKIAGLTAMISMGSYVVASFWLAIFSFLGQWLWFLTFYKKYPERWKWIAIATLFVPSVVFWGSGMLKDTVTIGALGYLVYFLDRAIGERKNRLLYLLLAAPFFYLAFLLKAYIVLALIPAFVIWAYMRTMNSLDNRALRIFMRPVVIVMILLMSNFIYAKVTTISGELLG